MRGAAGRLQPCAYGGLRFGVRRAARAAEFRKESVHGAVLAVGHGGHQPVPRRQEIGLGFLECAALVPEDLQRQSRVQLRIVQLPAPQRAVLVVLYEVVIGVAGKGERAEAEGVHRRQFEQPQIGLLRPQVGQVESDQVVAEDEGGAVGEIIEPLQRRAQAAAGMDLTPAGIRAHRAESMDDAVVLADLQVESQTSGRKGSVLVG